MRRGTRELSSTEMSSGAVGVFRCLRPLRRCRRLAEQPLMFVVLVVAVVVLISTHHRRPSTTSGQIGSASDTLPRRVRSVQEESSDSGRLIIDDDEGSNGFLVAVINGSRLTDVEFRSYGEPVELRLIVLAYNRPESLAACLESLEAAEYAENDRLSLHVWIDGCPADDKNGEEDRKKTVDVAQSFNFSHGSYHVHVRPQHVGVQVGR